MNHALGNYYIHMWGWLCWLHYLINLVWHLVDVAMSIRVVSMVYHVAWFWYEMTLNYRVIVERYPFPNGVIGSSIPVVKTSRYLTEKKN